MDVDKLRNLHQLKEEGLLSEEEFQLEKEKLLNKPEPKPEQSMPEVVAGVGTNQQQYSMLMHLSLLIGLVLPIVGLIVPLILWLTKKDNNYIDQNGRIIVNWLISYAIYAFVSMLLILIIIGAPMLVALAVCHVVFAIMGALKAKDGILWHYPLSIKFFKVELNTLEAQ
ncbi:hypothetical protein CWE15_09045 [Aliidiomarina taiwanensis]|uniref:SHOCT domain-containing protein n=1 Tax=Aliidiomarina taiwanensis TaxID=946228 RepID=A0A432X1G6_9GAMM|nr:DUF4870 domain-containing protein [Aliidiomarina taiwanensis]RUO39887.1 hypothetical protein CWE15_09045 [Aliidiomarina taiwanensis]